MGNTATELKTNPTAFDVKFRQEVVSKRKEMKLTQEQFAEKCGLSKSTVVAIESGRKDATAYSRAAIEAVIYHLKNYRPFGLRLRQARRNKKMTLDQLAKATGTTVATLSNIEQGNHYPRVVTHVRMRAVLGEI